MGFDTYGRKARSEKGEYFGNNIWWWRPLADYVLDHTDIPECDGELWHSNEGYEISAASATELGDQLTYLLETGRVARFARIRERQLQMLPDEVCLFCDGTGRENRKTCSECKGRGLVRPFATWYEFSVENVADFATFCAESGGFEIR